MQTLEQVAAIRAQLWDAGYRPLAVLNYDHANKAVAGKAPIGKDWGNRARQNPPECTTLPPVKHALNTGILTDGLRAIDIDIDDKEIASRCRSIIVGRFGEAPIRMRRNSSRCLLLYRAAVGEPSKIIVSGTHGKIEVLGRGQQFVAYGKHPSGADLEWFPDGPGQEPLHALVAITEADILEALAECAPILGAPPPASSNGADHASSDPQADPLRIAAALNAIPNEGPADWEAWNRVGMAVWRATGGSETGWVAWDAWGARNASYDAVEARARWDHFFISPPTSIGAGTIFHMAKEAVASAKPEPEIKEKPRKEGDIFPLEMFRDVEISTDANDFVEGLMNNSSMVVIYGESNSGKTFFATDLGLHVACGWEWNGRAVERGGVIYLALEGSHGIRHRIAAFRDTHGLQGHDIPFAIIPVSMNLLDPNADTDKLIRTIKSVASTLSIPVRLIIPDTLSRAMAGGNENAPDDMGALVTNGTKIQQETGSAVGWVHHSGKDQAKGARGHSLLRAATDTEIEIIANGPQRSACVTKQREMECSGEFNFTLKVVELGTNHRGKAITSCVVDYDDREAGERQLDPHGSSSRRQLKGHNKRALEVLMDLVAASGKSGFVGTPSGYPSVPEKWWRDAFYERAMPGEKDDTKLKAFTRAAAALMDDKLIGMSNRRVWIVHCHSTEGSEHGA